MLLSSLNLKLSNRYGVTGMNMGKDPSETRYLVYNSKSRWLGIY